MTDTRPPAVGDVAPDFAALDASGKLRRSAELLADRPLVLVFYRGHW
jgi:peroxiredoxin